jgi:hypothetical protein
MVECGMHCKKIRKCPERAAGKTGTGREEILRQVGCVYGMPEGCAGGDPRVNWGSRTPGSLRSNVDRRGKLELKARLGCQLQVLLASTGDRRAGHPADSRANRGP